MDMGRFVDSARSAKRPDPAWHARGSSPLSATATPSALLSRNPSASADQESRQTTSKARERTRSGRLEGIRSLPIAPLEEVPVDVVGGPDGGVPEPLGDYVPFSYSAADDAIEVGTSFSDSSAFGGTP